MIKVAAERRLSSLGVQQSQLEGAGGLGQVKVSCLHLISSSSAVDESGAPEREDLFFLCTALKKSYRQPLSHSAETPAAPDCTISELTPVPHRSSM